MKTAKPILGASLWMLLAWFVLLAFVMAGGPIRVRADDDDDDLISLLLEEDDNDDDEGENVMVGVSETKDDERDEYSMANNKAQQQDEEDDDQQSPEERQALERLVLTQLFDAVQGTESMTSAVGGNWKNDDVSYCVWKGIICTSSDTVATAEDQEEYRWVEEIDLSHEELEGTLPTELALLDHLTAIQMGGNKLWGHVPTELLSMSSLNYLDLGQNWLSGTLPTALDGTADIYSPLSILQLSNNRFTGSLPQNLPRAWTGLRYLDVSHNELTGAISIREMSHALPSLEFLWLGGNRLDGPLETNTATSDSDDDLSWDTLRAMDLGSNLISGSIPTSLCKLSLLETLILADNVFYGNFPPDLFQMSSLWTLQLQNNVLSGTLPEGEDGAHALGWSNLSNLGSLLLQNNQVSGTIPASLFLGLQSHLRHLDLSHNRFTGTVASEVGLLRRLHTISATSNKLGGSLPTDMIDMDPNLRLNFTDNLITGEIPSMFCGYGAANMLYREFGCDAVLCRPGTFSDHGHATLHSACRPCPATEEGEAKDPPESTILGRTTCENVDFVHGDLNADGILSPREILRMIYVDNLGSFWGATFQPWADLRVGECELAGITCNDMGKIHTIDLSTANLCSDGDRRPGPIEFCFGLPAEIGEISSLEVLKMENRQFLRGTIPSEIGKLTQLQLLDISGCSSMSGTIPSELANLTNLKYLHLSHGRFRGTIPPGLFEITGLTKFHLTNNLFSGTLSSSIGKLSNLKELMLSRNKLTGSLPSEIGGLVQLENFEGYYNSFEGELPSELGNCRELKRIDIFNNKFSGTLPKELASVSVLQILHVKLNQLSGTIPAEFGELSFLSWFDVSNNKMHGTIPASFATSPSIRDFRLGANMIYDPIPAGLCNNPNINGGVTAEFGCDGVLCPLGSYSDVGHAMDDDVGCTKCPEGETTMYLGANACEALTEENILSIFYEVLRGDTWPDDMKTNWGDPSIPSCQWAGISCDSEGEIMTVSFPLLGDSTDGDRSSQLQW